MAKEDTTIGLKADTKEKLRPIKKESSATNWDEFIENLAEGALDISVDDIEAREVRTEERVERTRATVVGVLEAVDETDMTDEVVEIIKSLSEQDMLAQNQDIIDHLINKSRKGEPINEIDHLLAQVVMETEQARGPEQSPAAAIAKGLFAEKDRAAAERTTTERDISASSGEDDGAKEEVVDLDESTLNPTDEDSTTEADGVETSTKRHPGKLLGDDE